MDPKNIKRAEEIAGTIIGKFKLHSISGGWDGPFNLDLIAKALEDYAKDVLRYANEAFEKGREQGAFECRHAAGIAAASMRERAAEIATKEIANTEMGKTDRIWMRCAKFISDGIRALPLSEPEVKNG